MARPLLSRDAVRFLPLLVSCFLVVACGGSRKTPARPVDDRAALRGAEAVEREPQTTAATVTASTGDDLSWLSPVYFAFDSSDLTAATREALVRLHEWLAVHPKAALTIEGHCDEQGTTEYNIGLGQRRAQAMVDYLVRLGTAASRLQATSYGAERPAVEGHDEVAWSKNRRGEFRVGP